MQTIARSCILILWMQILTTTKSEGCTLEQFTNGALYDSNFDISNLEASYPLGRQIRVNCKLGYSGFFKLICTKNGWEHRGKKCEPKSCGHPGEAAFADFTLVSADDFVFGSKVVYTCHTGFQMISRINHRNCLAEGWDGVVPVCEAIQCPEVQVENNVQVIGESFEAAYGNVVRFVCKYNYEVLLGSQESYCDENGKWSSPPPTCQEIKCLKPAIENGNVKGNIKEYKENEFLNFDCNLGFIPADNITPKCTKLGIRAEWTPAPRCEPIRCKLLLPAVRGTSYYPNTKNRFTPGENVTVTCEDKYWVRDRLTTSVTTTCKKDGKWSIDPICQEVICLLQHYHPMYRWTQWNNHLKKDETLGYYCSRGYKKPHGVYSAKCTREGLEPDPLCQAIRCPRKDIPNTELVNKKNEYGYNERAHYKCIGGYTGVFSLHCWTDGQWEGYEMCEEIKCEIEHRQTMYTWETRWKNTIKVNETLGYQCNGNYKKPDGVDRAKCTNAGVLEPDPLCEELECDKKEIPNTELINRKNKYVPGERAEYKCIDGYEGEFHMLCLTNGQWRGTPVCDTKCKRPTISEADITSNDKESYKHKEKVTFTCNNKGRRVFDVVCQKGNWTGIQNCSGCVEPEITNGFAKGLYNEMVSYTCDDGYKLTTEGWWAQAKCDQGQWPQLERCIDESHCGPVPPIPNGEVTPMQPSYEQYQSVTIDCKTGYQAQITKLTCVDGEWSPKDKLLTPICTHADETCSPPAKVDNAVISTQFQNIYLSGSEVTYICRGDTGQTGVEEAKIRCIKGEWEKTTLNCATSSMIQRV